MYGMPGRHADGSVQKTTLELWAVGVVSQVGGRYGNWVGAYDVLACQEGL